MVPSLAKALGLARGHDIVSPLAKTLYLPRFESVVMRNWS